ncbi:unnamed protein product [Angiostrongylus costaricensis]|uniref:PlsC domain-containing protein n=1 Tax=Angiostrongylus costaricensis TaxID=334426 RepID=A0A0R3PTU2_ANGCS|nr:unnamed protein product [Angiostrongylus costaricensis]
MRIKINQENPLVSIACGQFALSLMQSTRILCFHFQAMFMFYYVKVYLVVFRVPQLWFNVAQSLFMFWNAINDPIFGYLQDKPGSWMNSRTRVIRSFAPYLASSFALMWFPWSEGSYLEGLHLIVSLFLYDAFYSAVGVAWGALFADSTKEPGLRILAVKYSQIAILISVNIVVVTEKLSHSLERFWVFQLIASFVAVIAVVCFILAGSLKRTFPLLNDEVNTQQSSARGKEVGSMLVSMREIFFQRDFVAIVVTNFVHSARSITHMNFASTATDLLIPQTIIPKGTPLSSLVFSMNALFVKPAQSVAPVLVVYILDQYGYSVSDSNYAEYISNKQPSDDLVFAMRTLLFALPVVLGSIQYSVFKRYSLHDKHMLKSEEDRYINRTFLYGWFSVDWVVLVMLAQRQGRYGNDAGFRVMVKHIIHYVPLFGWYIFQHGYVYVRRFGELLYGPVVKQLSWLDSLREPFWLLIFPEGTRNFVEGRCVCRHFFTFTYHIKVFKGIPELSNVLCPRVSGILLAVERLDSLDAVYDVTIAYGQTRLPNRRGVAPSMLEFVCGERAAKVLSVHVKRYSAKELRMSRKELQDWIMRAYSEKDRLLEDYYKTGEFPEPVSLDEQSVSICRTLPPTLLFVAALVAPYYVPAVRNVYLLTLASSPLLIFWLEATKCV